MTTILEATQQLITEGLIEQTNAPEPLENATVALTDEGRTEAVALVHHLVYRYLTTHGAFLLWLLCPELEQ